MPTTDAGRRAVLLGASNLARGLAAAVAAAGRARPAQILVAGGRGRAYARASALLVRGLPSILGCGLWRALGDGDGPVFALVTDIGNDLVYGASVDETLGAVERVIDRLTTAGARPAMTTLPLASLDRFPAAWLDAVRRSVFPSSTLEVEVLVERAHRLDAELRRLGERPDVDLVEQRLEWYGLDPIHHKLARRTDAFIAMTAPWGGRPRRPDLALRRRLAAAWPTRSTLCGRTVHRRQPSARLADGAAVSLY